MPANRSRSRRGDWAGEGAAARALESSAGPEEIVELAEELKDSARLREAGLGFCRARV